MVLGYVVLAVLAGLSVGAALLALWAFFPARFDWKRNTPSLLKTPSATLAIDALIGVSSRGKAKWFFGFMLVSPGQEPQIVTPKAKAQPHD